MLILLLISILTSVVTNFLIKSRTQALLISVTASFSIWIILQSIVVHPMANFGRYFVGASLGVIFAVSAAVTIVFIGLKR